MAYNPKMLYQTGYEEYETLDEAIAEASKNARRWRNGETVGIYKLCTTVTLAEESLAPINVVTVE